MASQVGNNTIRGAAQLLTRVFYDIDTHSGSDGDVSDKAVKSYLDKYGDNGGSFDQAVNSVHGYAQKRYKSEKHGGTGDYNPSPSMKQIRKAIGAATTATIKGDTDKSGRLNTDEQEALQTPGGTWTAFIAFAKDYEGQSIAGIMSAARPVQADPNPVTILPASQQAQS